MLKNIGSTEIIIIAVLLLVLFGGKKIPEFVRGIAQAIREFRSATKDENKEEE